MFYKDDIVKVVDAPEWGLARVVKGDGGFYLLEFPKEQQIFHNGFGVRTPSEECPLGNHHYYCLPENNLKMVEQIYILPDAQDLI